MSEKRYRCIKKFYVPLCDDDGCEVESGEMASYDFDAKKYRCEEFMLELGIEVGE